MAFQGKTHEAAQKALEPAGKEAGLQFLALVVGKLCFNAAQTRRPHERFQRVLQQFTLVTQALQFRVYKEVADNPFFPVVEEETVAANPSFVYQGVTGEPFVAQAGVDDTDR